MGWEGGGKGMRDEKERMTSLREIKLGSRSRYRGTQTEVYTAFLSAPMVDPSIRGISSSTCRVVTELIVQLQ